MSEPQAAVYCRISDDRRGQGLGVARQRDDCEALAKTRGFNVTTVLTDNDVSAYSGKSRPAYRQLLDLVRSGQVAAVLAWDPDRLHRSPAELEEFIALVERHNVRVDTVQAGEWDLTTPAGRLMARQLGSIARYESEHKAERVKRALKQNAQAGKTHGRPTYGWRREYDPETGAHRDVIAPDEAAVVRQIADRIIAGDSLRAITADLNEAEVPTPRRVGDWSKGMVRHLVQRERNAGLRVHHGEVVGDGAWDPLLDRSTYEQVRAILRDPARRTSSGSAAKHLLSGIGKCGECGAPLRASQNRTVASYRCTGKSCVSRARADVDGLVVGVLLKRLERPDALALATAKRGPDIEAAVSEAHDLRARLDTAADDYADGKIDARQLERITARLRPQIAAAEARARTVDDAPLLDGLVGSAKAEAIWESLPITRQRAIVDLLLEVRVYRTRAGAREFDPQSVSLEWRR